MKVNVRSAVCADARSVFLVESQCFQTPWSYDSICYELCENPLAAYVVAENKKGIIGFGGMHKIVGEGHITNIAVIESCRGKGIGRKIVEALFDLGGSDIQSYTLEVRASNKPALHLYASLGFAPLGVRPKYYTDTGEDAIIMWRE